MKVEVVVDKDNTHFTYMHECDKVKDDTSGMYNGKLVLLKEGKSLKTLETVAVYAVWTSWIKCPDGAEKCERCARYRILNTKGYCHDCQAHLDYEAKQPCQRAR